MHDTDSILHAARMDIRSFELNEQNVRPANHIVDIRCIKLEQKFVLPNIGFLLGGSDEGGLCTTLPSGVRSLH